MSHRRFLMFIVLVLVESLLLCDGFSFFRTTTTTTTATATATTTATTTTPTSRMMGKARAATIIATKMNVLPDDLLMIPVEEEQDTTTEEDEEESDAVVDKNGNVLEVGAIVRVAVDGLAAYQINKKGYGSFQPDGTFVPLEVDADTPRKNRCLMVPVGMRGVVNKVYNVNEVSSNLPIQVRFKLNENTQEGFNPPAMFLMHFTSDEVEVCTDL